MQNPKLGDASFAMSTTCCNDHDWGDSSYDLENLFKSHDEYEIIAIAPILDSSLNQKHDCNDFIINSFNVNCVNDMQNPKLGDASFSMSSTYCNGHDWGDNAFYDLENLFKPHDKYAF